jgi:hypothetical protein
VIVGWLAAKFSALGRYSWSICDYDEAAMTNVDATCTAPRPFLITFRLATLTGSAARSDARRVYKKLTRFGLPRSGAKCRLLSRTKRSCKVGTCLGDALIYGRVVLWNKRPSGVRTYNLTRYRATLRIYDEYCRLVNHRPRSECDKPYKKLGLDVSGLTFVNNADDKSPLDAFQLERENRELRRPYPSTTCSS